LILFLDDEPFFVDGYKLALEAAGFQVSLQRKVDEAIRLIERENSDVTLVITDIMMPSRGMFSDGEAPESDLTTGFAFYDRIRRRSPHLPVIILTNKSKPDVDQKFAREANCCVFRKGPRCPPLKLVQQAKEMLKVNG